MACGCEITLDQQTYWKYNGDVRCPECRALLSVMISSGQLKETPKIKEPASREQTPAMTEPAPEKGS
jgi:hypothetical protein